MQVYLQKKLGQVSEARKAKGVKRKIWLHLVYHFGENIKRQYEHLGLFLYDKPTTHIEKEHNKETLSIAEQIRAKRLLEAQANQYGLLPSFKKKTSFVQFLKQLIKEKQNTITDTSQWESLLKHFLKFIDGRDVLFEEVNEVFLENFKKYLLSKALTRSGRKLSNNTAVSYFNRIKTTFKEAYMQRIITDNPATRVKSIKEQRTKREYLTLEELQSLSKAECEMEIMKKAFLFSALTGLRHCDIRKLTWGEIHYEANIGWLIRYTQQKTQQAENLPISEQAVKLIEPDVEAVKRKCRNIDLKDVKIFFGLSYDCWANKKLKKWMLSAGIDKKITFHCARHTFATLQLSLNTDISTVSKMLGHQNLKTTQIYAKVIDMKKVEAANKIPDLMN